MSFASSFATIANAIQDTNFFTSVRESGLAYPVIMSTHLASIALFGGMIVMTDLRLLGLAMTATPVSDLIKQLRPWKHAGLTLMLVAGILLGGAKLGSYYDNPYFQIKMTLLLLVGVHALVFRNSVYRNPDLDRVKVMPGNARAAAIISLVLWFGIMSAGRWIAYFERPEDKPKRRVETTLLKQRLRPAAPQLNTGKHARGQS